MDREALARPSLALLLALACPAFLPAGTQSGAVEQADADTLVVRTGEAFVLRGHGVAAPLVESGLELLEGLPQVFRQVTGAAVVPEAPLEVNLYGTFEAYRAADRARTGGRFQRNLAYADWDSRTAHVALQPDADPAVFAAVGLPLLTRKLLCHEACHLLRYTDAPNYRWHPDWLADGLAMEVSWRAVCPDPARRAGQPMALTNLKRAKGLLDQERLPSPIQLLLDGTDGLEFYERYSARGAFMAFLLAEHPDLVQAAYRDAKKLGAIFPARALAGAVRKRAAAEWEGLEDGFHGWLRGRRAPWWDGIRAIERRGDDLVQIAFSDSNAITWRDQAVGPAGGRWSGSFRHLPADRQQLNLLLGRTQQGFVQVAFMGSGRVTLLRYRSGADEPWEQLGTVDRERTAPQEPVPFQVVWSAADGLLRVAVAGATVLEHAVPLPAEGEWGLGALAGSAGVWHQVRCEPFPEDR